MPTTQETIALVQRRALWLEGKNREMRTEEAANRSETDWAVRTYGARPSSFVFSLLGPTGALYWGYQRWDGLDRRMAAATSSKAANVRRAVASLQEMMEPFRAAEQGATQAQMATMTQLRQRVNEALQEGERLYGDWINHPAARYDQENTTLSNRMFRVWASVSPGGAVIRGTGTTAHQAWQAVGQPVVDWATAPSAGAATSDIYGQHAGSAAAKDTAAAASSRGAWDWKDYLAAVGAGVVGAGALYMVFKARSLTPAGMATGVARRALVGKPRKQAKFGSRTKRRRQKPRTKFRGRK